jgi:hypothetical protein
VNLTAKLREAVKAACPGMEMRFIPAGATGKFQVNDTHLHKPLKDRSTSAAQRWRVSRILLFRQLRDANVKGGASKAEGDMGQAVGGEASEGDEKLGEGRMADGDEARVDEDEDEEEDEEAGDGGDEGEEEEEEEMEEGEAALLAEIVREAVGGA